MAIVGGSAELNTGARIPLIGLGTASMNTNEEDIKAAVIAALQVGYRHFDTARAYGSEHALGKALNSAFQSGLVSREDVFVTTKLQNTEHDDPVATIKDSLMNLQLEYVDLFLIHWPIKLRTEIPFSPLKEEDFLPLDIKSTWQGMEQCMEMGLTKAIGVSNFSSKKIEDLLKHAKIPPAVDQVEMHPNWQQKKLRDYCSKHNIHVSAWSPLGAPNTPWGSNAVMDNPLFQEIAQKYGKTRAQVMLRWAIDQGVSPVPKSYNAARIAENFQVFDWSLTPDDHEKISKLEQKKIQSGEQYVNSTTSPYKTVEELWDGEI
ncbi:non-functional NADPH-dependent codeinone reductase 2 [Cryptomeria japonica]|uniref:non-functional NADPH-dependent codeinone reductase 2 n=1 Tax=Cryptomeria japonica TaxID=3369 RepID=UPI0025AD1679|nr:non-functional NADPH-dependent codeinone reductase 2 [Cryptomeria japonica]